MPALTRVLSGEGRALVWAPDPGFDVGRHTDAVPGTAVDEDGLPSVVASLFEQRLPRDRPLWRIDVARMDGERAALIWRLHHAVADGTAAMRLCQGAAVGRGGGRPDAGASARHADSARDDDRRRAHLAAFVKREFSESLHRSPFDGKIGTRRRIAFAAVPFQPLHDAAKEIDGATVNDAVLAVTAGGLRRWLLHHHGDPGTVRLRVPVSLHSEHDDAGNRDSFFTLPVELDEEDPVSRLRDIHRRTQRRKREHDAERLEAGHGGPWAGVVTTRALSRAARGLRPELRAVRLQRARSAAAGQRPGVPGRVDALAGRDRPPPRAAGRGRLRRRRPVLRLHRRPRDRR